MSGSLQSLHVAEGRNFWEPYDIAGENRWEKYTNFSQKLDNSNEVPMTVSLMAEASFSHYSDVDFNQPDNKNIRMKTFTGVLVGSAFTLAWRIVRAIVRTVFLPFTLAYQAYKGSHYKVDYHGNEENRVKSWERSLQKVRDEWIDVGFTLASWGVMIANTFDPGANRKFIEKVRDYYLHRIDDEAEDDKFVQFKVNVYEANEIIRDLNTQAQRNAIEKKVDSIQAPYLRGGDRGANRGRNTIDLNGIVLPESRSMFIGA